MFQIRKSKLQIFVKIEVKITYFHKDRKSKEHIFLKIKNKIVI